MTNKELLKRIALALLCIITFPLHIAIIGSVIWAHYFKEIVFKE